MVDRIKRAAFVAWRIVQLFLMVGVVIAANACGGGSTQSADIREDRGSMQGIADVDDDANMTFPKTAHDPMPETEKEGRVFWRMQADKVNGSHRTYIAVPGTFVGRRKQADGDVHIYIRGDDKAGTEVLGEAIPGLSAPGCASLQPGDHALFYGMKHRDEWGGHTVNEIHPIEGCTKDTP